jgi:hypothetical protein
MLPMMTAGRSRSFSATCPPPSAPAPNRIPGETLAYAPSDSLRIRFGFASDDFGNAAGKPFGAVAEPFSPHVTPVVGRLR